MSRRLRRLPLSTNRAAQSDDTIVAEVPQATIRGPREPTARVMIMKKIRRSRKRTRPFFLILILISGEAFFSRSWSLHVCYMMSSSSQPGGRR